MHLSTRQLNHLWKWFKAMLFVLPALACYIIFSTVPIINTIQLSFYNWNGASVGMKFIGFENYKEIFTDPIFWKALSHNIFWIVFTIVIPVMLGFFLAVLLNQKAVKFRLIFKVTYFMPAVVSLVAVGVVWDWIYDPTFGILNRALKAIGLSVIAFNWLGNPSTVLFALLIAGSWTYYGFCMVIYIAAYSGIDTTYTEVALIEGANPFQTFIYVIVPLLRSTTTLLILNSLIGSFKVFDIVYVMTRGGPFYSSEVISTYMFRTAFNFNEVGKGAAISVVLAVFIAICSVVYMRYSERED
jgi:raffinose/stachyose/melibiose transport system permease protein